VGKIYHWGPVESMHTRQGRGKSIGGPGPDRPPVECLAWGLPTEFPTQAILGEKKRP